MSRASVVLLLPALGLGGLADAVVAQDTRPSRYESACEAGDAAACVTAGLLLEAGRGASGDLARAAELYELACDGGAPNGCTSLGLLYESGSGVNRDVDRAARLFRSACEQGESLACDRLRSLVAAGMALPVGRGGASGRVADGATDQVLADAVVEVPALGMQATSDAAGRFELPDLPAGRHLLRAERFGYEVLELDLVVPGAEDLLLLLRQGAFGDPAAPGRVVGRVTENGRNRGLSDVDVSVLGQVGTRTLSNDQGRYTLRDVRPGLVQVQFDHLGYASRTAALILQPGRTVEVAATLATQAIELEPIQVTVRNSFLIDNGFYRRESRGFGNHFDRGDLDRIDLFDVSDLLWRVPGVRVRYDLDQAYAVGRRGCVLPLWVDGVQWPVNDINDLPPEWLEAVEVYSGIGMPVQYSSFNDCGVVLIWTRR